MAGSPTCFGSMRMLRERVILLCNAMNVKNNLNRRAGANGDEVLGQTRSNKKREKYYRRTVDIGQIRNT